jgi:hypothetical protein
MKTQLPERIKSSIKFYPTNDGVQERSITAGEVANTLNKLIDYLTELTAVVEGKQGLTYSGCSDGKNFISPPTTEDLSDSHSEQSDTMTTI